MGDTGDLYWTAARVLLTAGATGIVRAADLSDVERPAQRWLLGENVIVATRSRRYLWRRACGDCRRQRPAPARVAWHRQPLFNSLLEGAEH